MFTEKNIDFNEQNKATGTYTCSNCGKELFSASKKFDAGCGFPSFWMHIEEGVQLKPLHTYGRHRIQLVCNQCGKHLGHLFSNPYTPTKVRYCINHSSIQFKEKE